MSGGPWSMAWPLARGAVLRLDAALLLGTALSSGMPVLGQVVPGGAEAPGMDAAGNGTRVVTINTPNSRGLSNNTYSDFNVGPGGLILNNSPAIVSTALAGYIDGNARLKATGPAAVILNQVVGGNPSTLAGYLEVAGFPAQVIPTGASTSGRETV